ncbi:PPM-type phosphatase domain-containing protein [Desulfonema magnum]|uniref:PPM-type phosphatase domain-containing protein n=2 Tax=Desulfonema magnum TaxID=45655 RepID=A0A975BLD0_9BACT|nr:PPM-type phosphatase domain-containing protein [Desulfonema magnum]
MISVKRLFADLSIRYKFISGIALILVVAMLSLSIVFIQQSEEALLDELENKAKLITRNFSVVSEKGIQESAFSNLQALINEVTATDEDINILLVGYANTFVIATSDQKNYQQFSRIQDDYILQQLQKEESSILRDKSRHILKIIQMIYDRDNQTDQVSGQHGELLGFIYTELHTTRLEQAVSHLWMSSIALILLIITIGIVGAWGCGTTMAKPIGRLAEDVRVIASGNLEKSVYSERNDELGQLVSDVEKMRLAIKALTEDVREQERLKKEMEVAQKIQTVLLPKKPNMLGYDIAATLRPSEEVGGDYYDVISVGGYKWIVIGDVSGHGLTSGLVMMMVQTAIHTVLLRHPSIDPSDMLAAINKTIYLNIQKMDEAKHMTIVVLAVSQNGHFTFSGLHEDILIRRSRTEKLERIKTNGMWIGMEPDISEMLSTDSLDMETGDTMVLYTDGIIEAMKPEGGFFGQESLEEIVERCGDKSALEIHKEIMDALASFEKPDDVTLFVMKRL